MGTSSAGQDHNKPEAPHLPLGVDVVVSLDSAISPALAASNDVVRATVVRPVFVNGREVIARGAILEGHLRSRPGGNAVIVELDRVQTRLGWAPFYARLTSLGPTSQARIQVTQRAGQMHQTLQGSDDEIGLADLEVPDVHPRCSRRET